MNSSPRHVSFEETISSHSMPTRERSQSVSSLKRRRPSSCLSSLVAHDHALSGEVSDVYDESLPEHNEHSFSPNLSPAKKDKSFNDDIGGRTRTEEGVASSWGQFIDVIPPDDDSMPCRYSGGRGRAYSFDSSYPSFCPYSFSNGSFHKRLKMNHAGVASDCEYDYNLFSQNIEENLKKMRLSAD
eukprot:CAMPEP_0172491470 /NCGR_PEP_ID=MMETSP1066-20121228/22316_1 /TAXON_ID=671091 /ORGANISM="Coscinodiscus wailesii, Strain CCMP2513" /LENGTH=184 /DNA_ID=CAMNT_0013260539 /DNA_START=142 /DNA_END=697 /DNA_ORIENTATION=-